ncbi:hypothetical protein ACFFX0_22245 [Citricoccus parietis]|uniref:Uncharacterized protein n=1 Tax=Citricoccus parietis TaxID=592307 RepID=A0ABV5G553_9MICC
MPLRSRRSAMTWTRTASTPAMPGPRSTLPSSAPRVRNSWSMPLR